MEDLKKGTLYIVGTPIGNLGDITLRALETFKTVDLIACEDTRMTKRILKRYEIKTPLISYHQHSKITKIDLILEKIKNGQSVALVTDAGTPGISDPGNILVAEAVKVGLKVGPIPGVSALTAMVSVSGIDMQKFTFLGFPPHKKGRQTFFKEVLNFNLPVVYYESPYRLIKNLELLKELECGKNIIIGRELTKIFEEIQRGSVDEMIDYFGKKEKIKGELVVILEDTK